MGQQTPTEDASSLCASLEPALRGASDGRLGPVSWFRTTWQRGGAGTGIAEWSRDDGTTLGVVVKLPVGYREYRWTRDLGRIEPGGWDADESRASPTPRIVASGEELGGYDLAWLVMERFPGKPLSVHMDEAGVLAMLDRAAEFQQRAAALRKVEDPPPAPDWGDLLEQSRAQVKLGSIPDGGKWNDAIRRVQRRLPTLAARWSGRECDAWCHGDLHPANAMVREGASLPGSMALIDLAMVHAGHWIEDALYLERCYWGHPELLCGVKPVPTLARLRKERGLCNGSGHAELADAKRLLAAASAPAMLGREGDLRHLAAALALIERLLSTL
ncbi:MAG: aminoglycoside phosphotransferase family protein [Phycisphaerales bacterium]|jgi:hypothetical protein|nr:aminoglycoside phosphotransferase family protein [Phycisphaerales bacterium]